LSIFKKRADSAEQAEKVKRANKVKGIFSTGDDQ
jgi:hypothetical protein